MTKKTASFIGRAAGAAAFALAVFAAPAALAEGSIRSIYAVATDQHSFPNLSDPIRVGETAKFDILLANKFTAAQADRYSESVTNSWVIRYKGSGSEAYDAQNNPLKLGVIVNGKLREATFDLRPHDTYGHEYTVMHVSYTAKAGDLAMPLILADSSGAAASESNTSTYYLFNSDLWEIVDAESGTALEFCFGGIDTESAVAGDLYHEEKRDMNLSLAGIYINTVGFDEYYEDGDVWRKVYRGMTDTYTSRLPSILIPGGNTDANAGTTVYLWVADTNCVTLATDGQGVKMYGEGANAHLAYPVSLLANQTNVTFRLRGVTADTETEIYMSAFPTNLVDGAGNIIENYVTRKVQCIASPDPFVRFTLNDGDSEATVAADTSYNTPKARIVIELSEPYTEAVTVKLNPVVKNGAEDVFTDNILGISLQSEAANFKDAISEVTIPAGQTSATVQIFALGATENTQSYGISFTPSVSGAAASFYTGEKRACTLYVNDTVPAIASPENGATLTQSFEEGISKEIAFEVSDSYADGNKTGWTAVYRDVEDTDIETTLENLSPKFNSSKGRATLNIPLELYTIPTSHIAIKVIDPNGNESEEIEFYANVVSPKTVAITLGSDQFGGVYTEGDERTVSVTLSQKYSKTALYAWIEGANEETVQAIANGLVECTAFSSRPLTIPKNNLTSNTLGVNMKFKDGCADTMDLQFKAVLRKENDAESEVFSDYNGDVFYAQVLNAAPAVTEVKVNGGGAVSTSGGTSGSTAAQGVPARFTVSKYTELSEFDKDDMVSRWVIERPNTSTQPVTITVTGNLATAVCEYTFLTGDTTYLVSVSLQDKDMEGGWTEEFTFYVNVSGVPTVTLTPFRSMNGSTVQIEDNILYESEVGKRAWLNVALSSEANVPLNVLLSVENLSDSGILELETYDVQFPSGSLVQRVYFSDLDGTRGTSTRGFRVNAAVTNEAVNADYGMKWSEFYSAASPLSLAVVNETPVIVAPAESSITNRDVTAGVPFYLDWEVQDVTPDLTNGMRIVWTAAGVRTIFEGDNLASGTFTNTFPATLSGLQTVTMQVQDKDGALTNRTWLYFLEPSKKLYLTPCGPASSSTAKYRNQPGLGRGRVFANGSSPVLTDFTQMWNFNVRLGSARLTAVGYSVGDVDNGTLDSTDLQISPNGSAVATGLPDAYYYVYDGIFKNDIAYDSFFYCWSNHSQEEQSLGNERNGYGSIPLPGKSGTISAWLPEYAEGSLSYPDLSVEAIFSREYRPLDNCGDINNDGVPDAYHQLYWPTSADATAGGGEDTVDDITRVNTRNEDEDYLPGGVPGGAPLVPGMTNDWVNSARAFTAVKEIRGFGDGLNTSGGEGSSWSRPGAVDPEYGDFSTAETIAYEIATNRDATAIGTWNPERPTSPILADTDGDGMPDGYEYYFWYYAKVGWMDAEGNHHFLEGERYNPLHPEKGTVISGDAITRYYDPVVAYDEMAGLDIDNDGIPDMQEFELGTNPLVWDTDGDGLPDGYEVYAGTDPLKGDSSKNPDGDRMAYTTVDMRLFPTISADGTVALYGITWPEDPLTDNRVVRTVEEGVEGWTVIPEYKEVDSRVVYIATKEPASFVNSLGQVILTDDLGESTLFTVHTEGGETYRGAPARLSAGTVLHAAPEATTWTRVKIEAHIGEEGYGLEATEAADRVFKIWEYGKNNGFAFGRETSLSGEFELFVHDQHTHLDIARVARVGIMHWQVYQQAGFDPRTAWGWSYSIAIGALNPRWMPSALRTSLLTPQTDLIENHSGVPLSMRSGFGFAVNTRAYSTYDEFLLQHFLYNTGSIAGSELTPTPQRTFTGYIWPNYTTVAIGDEQGTNENGDTIYSGADTDGDTVPDGWELYVMAGANATTNNMPGVVFTDDAPIPGYMNVDLPGGSVAYAYVTTKPLNLTGRLYFDSPAVSPGVSPSMGPWLGYAQNTILTDDATGDGDGLSESGEFAGTDVSLLFATPLSVHARCSEADAAWLNKFWPSDPWNADTDGDGLLDGNERDNLYTAEADDETKIVIPGGGLNPLSADTDIDGIPDGWELQYIGDVQDGETADGDGNTAQSIAGGMDGTVPDAYSWTRGRNCDYDRDGLQNWQEYMTAALRCFRYDDIDSPWTVASAADYLNADGTVNTQLWYAVAVVGGVSPHVLDGQFDWAAAYFATCGHGWDMAVGLSYMWADGPEHAGFGRKLTDNLRLQLGTPNNFPSSYVGCSPRNMDTDNDGMDDYWELFHGLNPMLGSPASFSEGGGTAADTVAAAYGNRMDALSNPWTADDPVYWPIVMQENIEEPAYRRTRNIAAARGSNKAWDYTTYLWMNGAENADPDGDDIRNQLEALVPNLEAQNTWLHTDPSPLWMTDTSYTNSLVRRYFRTIDRPGFTVYDMTATNITEVVNVSSETNIIAAASGDDPDNVYGVSTNIVDTTYSIVITNFDAPVILVTRTIDRSLVVSNAEYQVGEDPDWDVTEEPFSSEETYYLSPLVPGYSLNYWGVTSGYLFDFEENEGFDTDNDGLPDGTEITTGVTGATDPLNFDDPKNRQAVYFPGENSAMESRTNPRHGNDAEMFFLKFTVELWAKPEDVSREQTLIERTTLYPAAHSQDAEYMRRNFRIGITEDGLWFAGYDSKGTAATDGGTVRITGTPAAAGEWTHLALTYDGERLRLYVNGVAVTAKASGVQPANGVESVNIDGTSLGGYAYVGEHALILGASALEPAALSIEKAKPEWTAYGNFYKGYIDEVRVWDGARTSTEIVDAMNVRVDAEFAKANREEIYNAIVTQGRSRNNASANADLGEPPAELVYHYSFDSMFAASSPEYTAVSPYGFAATEVEGAANRAALSRPDGWTSTWWDELPVKSTVYTDYAYLNWAQNTLTHLPLFDGTTRDSKYWSHYYAGSTACESQGLKEFTFKNTAEPYGWYNAMVTSLTMYSTRDFLNAAHEEYGNMGDFTSRLEFTDGTDLLPLGGVYARTASDLWDGNGPTTVWTVTGSDENQNSLPDWWEDYIRTAGDVYSNVPDAITATSVVTRYGQEMTAGEAYMRDLAAGSTEEHPEGDTSLNQFADSDTDGLPDWWELLNGIQAETALDDSDNDQLSNFAEYLIGEAFAQYGFPLVNPKSMSSFGQAVPDYYLKVGSLYLGEMFADHDFTEDWWEDLQPVWYSSRFHYDAWSDADDDGWGNWSEARYSMQVSPIDASLIGHYNVDNEYVRDFPQPSLHVSLAYNGRRKAAAENSQIVVELSRDPAFANGAEAVFVASNANGRATSSGTDAALYRYLGDWREGGAVGTLAPGNVDYSALELQIAASPSADVYAWNYANCNDAGHVHEDGVDLNKETLRYGSYEEFKAAKLLCDGVQLVNRSVQWYPIDDVGVRTDGQGVNAIFTWADRGEVGTVNLLSGSYNISLDKLAGAKGNSSSTNTSNVVSIESGRVRIAYQVNESTGLPRTVHLDKASEGYLREGVNYIRAFADLDGNGVWSPGEPFGCSSPYGTEISWREASASVMLTDTSVSLPRFDLSSAVAENTSDSLLALNDRDAVGHVRYPNLETANPGTNMPTSTGTARFRIVRTMINDTYDQYRTGSGSSTIAGTVQGVVLDEVWNLSRHPFMTESDVLAAGLYDLDWGTLYENWTDTNTGMHQTAASFSIVTNVTYRIVVGDENASNFVTNNLIARVFRNGFELGALGAQTPCEPVSPAGIVTSGRITFRWRHDNTIGKDYPAFRLRVWNAAGSTLVYDSGIERAPARSQDGEYTWAAPLYVGAPTPLGHIFSTTNNYVWAVSMLDAKFTTVNTSETRLAFRVNTSGNLAGQSDHGTISCRVRYFGPVTVVGGTGPANVVRVQAFTSPDFTGEPAGEGWVESVDGIDSTGIVEANARIVGLEPGVYYVRAFIDTDGDRVKSQWESWGYANYIGTTRKQTFDPKSFTLSLGSNERREAEIYIEDVDTDKDGFPDAWEYASASAARRADGTFLSQRGPASGPTYYTQVNPDLLSALEAYDIAGYSEFLTFVLAAEGSTDSDGDGLNDFAELLLGTDPLSSEGAKAEDVSVQAQAPDGLTVPIKISAAKVVAGSASLPESAAIYTGDALEAAAASPATVRWTLKYAPELSGSWEIVGEGTVSLTETTTEAEILEEARKSPAYNPERGFYKVFIEY